MTGVFRLALSPQNWVCPLLPSASPPQKTASLFFPMLGLEPGDIRALTPSHSTFTSGTSVLPAFRTIWNPVALPGPAFLPCPTTSTAQASHPDACFCPCPCGPCPQSSPGGRSILPHRTQIPPGLSSEPSNGFSSHSQRQNLKDNDEPLMTGARSTPLTSSPPTTLSLPHSTSTTQSPCNSLNRPCMLLP